MLILGLPWYEQPQGAVAIDLANPLNARITHLLPLNGDPRELVTGAQLTYGSGGSNVVTTRGQALRGSGAAACASVPIDLSAYNKCSVSFWLYWDLYTNSDNLALEYGANYVINSGFLVDPSSGAPSSGQFQCGIGSPGVSNAGSFARPSAAAWHHYAFLFDRTTGAAQGSSVFVDAVAQSVAASGAMSDVADQFGNNALYIFSRANGSLFGAGRMQNLVIRGGYLMSAADVWQEYSEPWSLFRSRSIEIPVAATAGAPAICLLSDGSLAFKTAAGGTDKKVYLTTAGRLESKLAAGVGDKLLTMVNGRLQAT